MEENMANQGTAIRTTQLAPGRFRFSRGRSGALGGRPAGTEQPVPLEDQEATRSYCACGRRLNANNQSGLCRTCAPHGRPRSADPCSDPRGHRWNSIKNDCKYWAKSCIHCGLERPFTDAEIAAQRKGR